jgi:tripeptide aminopeptidase
MPLMPRAEASELFSAVQQEVVRLAALVEVRSVFAWLLSHESQISEWQLQVAQVPAPPFGEQARTGWLLERFMDLGLEEAHSDEVGNVFGIHRGTARAGAGQKFVALSAHIDTVFPAGTPLSIRREGTRLYGPGISDNGAGVAALLGVAAAFQENKMELRAPILFVGNVGEEGEGDLRGMRHIFADAGWKEAIAYNLILDGAGCDTIVTEALGSRRFEVIVRGPGGHSWSDFGAPNPIVVLARAIETFRQAKVSSIPKTTFNIGVIRGGTSVNSIPESASMRVDIRSTSTAEIERLEQALRVALDNAVEDESEAAEARAQMQRRSVGLSSEVVAIGDRPAGELAADARMRLVIKAVDALLGNVAQTQRASTDANIPLSLGREAIAIGGGGSGGGAHTLHEWFDCAGRDLGLKRILLTLLALAGVGK